MSNFPTSPGAVTREWLSGALGYEVDDFQISPLAEGVGMMALVTRVTLKASGGHPQSIIAKFPSPSADNRAVAETYNMYGREIQFYRDIAPSVSLRAPACYFAGFDEASNDFALLIEDLQGYRIGDQVAGCTLDEAHAIISTIAGFHADGWQPKQFKNLTSHNNPMQRDGMIAGWKLGWPVVLEQFADLVPPAAMKAGDRMPEAVGPLLARMCQEPVALTHGDVRLDNIFFGADGEIALVDWQAICSSSPEQDLSYFVTQSVPVEIRDQDALIRFYHSELTARGVDYSLDACRERYRVSALYLLCFAVVIAGTLDLANERGAALGRTLLHYSLSALDEIDAFELLK